MQRVHKGVATALLGAALLALWWGWPDSEEPPGQRLRRSVEEPARPPVLDVDAGPTAPTPAAPQPATPAAAGCAPRDSRRCIDGDPWWIDSCGERGSKIGECGRAPCQDGACEYPDPLGCDEPETGRCAGDVVRTCFGGRLRLIDCAAQGLHCVMGFEGAECRAQPEPSEPAATCLGEDARCEGDVLVQCTAGREQRVDCAQRLQTCFESVSEGQAACGYPPGLSPWSGLSPEPEECGPCGCEVDEDVGEQCNGADDDGDGLLDEGVDCGPIEIVAFVVGSPGRFGSYTIGDIEREMRQVNGSLQLSAGDAPALGVELVDVVFLERPDWLELSEEELQALVVADVTHPPSDTFYVPLLFTDEVSLGGVPKPGASTLPNGACGGSQRGRGPEVGLIAVSKARPATTVTHEIGHFLGLCHTHEDEHVTGVEVVLDERGQPLACDAPCRGEGDGICDTPADPGAQLCPYNSQCQVFCPGPEAPDVTNVMSYYTQCRFRFTPEQLDRMAHTLALRRAWHACGGRSCPCSPGGRDCPPEMGCRPVRAQAGEVAYRCALQGDGPPGAACESSYGCRADAVCVEVRGEGRCVRLCDAQAERGCACEILPGSPLSLCRDDLG